MTNVPLKTVISDAWIDLSSAQKFIMCVAVLAVFGIVSGSLLDSFRSRQETKVYEAQAAEAERTKNEALTKAADIAQTVKVREEELAKLVEKRDVKNGEVKQSRDAVSAARADYERAVRARRPDAPSSDELCRELAAAGHACQPR